MSRVLLMANRIVENSVEAEPVLVDTSDPERIVLELDDGEVLELDAEELKAALGEAA